MVRKVRLPDGTELDLEEIAGEDVRLLPESEIRAIEAMLEGVERLPESEKRAVEELLAVSALEAFGIGVSPVEDVERVIRVNSRGERVTETAEAVIYEYQSPAGERYFLHYSAETGVLELTKNVAPNLRQLEALQNAIEDAAHTNVALKVQPFEREIILGRITEIRYLD